MNMDINRLQKALAIINKNGYNGNVYGYHDEVQIYPITDSFTEEEVSSLDELGFMPTEDDEGFFCFT